MAKRLRDVCALPESECPGAPDAASSSAIGLSLKIAQPFMAGFTVPECLKSRQGRKKIVCRP
jgi:hypothetical protein